MKRTLIALGVAAAVALPVAAQAAPKVYGKLNVAVDFQDDDTITAATSESSKWQLNSYASRFGIKGEDELTASVSAVYGIEWTVVADGDGTDLGQRNRFVGLKNNSIGTLRLGKLDTPLKNAGTKIDIFKDQPGEYEKVLTGNNRANNVIDYLSPKIADAVTVNLQLILAEQNTPVAPAEEADNGLVDRLSASVAYEDDAIYAAIAYDKRVPGTYVADTTFQTALPAGLAGTPADTLRVVGSYSFKDLGLKLAALYQTSERSDTLDVGGIGVTPKESGFTVNAAYKFAENYTAKLAYTAATTEYADGVEDVDTTVATVGLEYAFTKSTNVYGYYALWNAGNDNNAATVPTPAPATYKTSDYDKTNFGVGISHSF